MIFFSIKTVDAQTYKLTLEKQDGIYYARKGGDLPYKSSQFSIYKFGDIIAYCIEPSKQITTWNYTVNDGFIDLSIPNELKEKLELIGYYGREYPNHDNVRYSMATQALIWELTGNQEVTFWTERYEKGTLIDVTKEKEEIMALVNKHYVLPNIPDNIEAYLKKEIIIQDDNQVLNDYEIVDNANQKLWIENNALHIISENITNVTIKLIKAHYD